MRHAMLAIVALSAVAFGAASAADYWPMQHGLIWRYGSGSPTDFEFTMTCADSACVRGYTQAYGDHTASRFSAFHTTAGGDIALTGRWSWETGGLDPDVRYFDPPLLFLDLPLEVGKQWFSGSGGAILIGLVTGESTVVTPAGTYDVFVVELDDVFDHTELGGTYYLERSIGPVKYMSHGLSYFNGTVGTASLTWGGLKAMYR